MGYSSDTQQIGARIPDVVEQPCGLYPGVEAFSADYDEADYRDWVDQSNGDPLPAPLVLYVQNETTTGVTSPAGDLAGAISRELRLQGTLFDGDRPLKQLIFSGSIATGWSDDQLYQLVADIQSSFYVNHDSLTNWCACAIGSVPSMERLRLLRVLGFNHLRIMPESPARETPSLEPLVATLQRARQLGFRSTILDTRRLRTDRVALQQALTVLLAEAPPDRIRLVDDTPGAAQDVDVFMASFGYRDIGLGWYLRTGDSWWHAKNSDRLYWTLLGFCELRNPDIVGVGPGTLSAVCDFYALNESSPQDYTAKLQNGTLPVAQGMVLEDADVLRREIIAMVLASSRIRVTAIENKWGIRFEKFFSCESELLRAFEQNNWVRWQGDCIEIRARAYRELIEICRVFDGCSSNPLTHVAHPGGTPPGAARGHSANCT